MLLEKPWLVIEESPEDEGSSIGRITNRAAATASYGVLDKLDPFIRRQVGSHGMQDKHKQ